MNRRSRGGPLPRPPTSGPSPRGCHRSPTTTADLNPRRPPSQRAAQRSPLSERRHGAMTAQRSARSRSGVRRQSSSHRRCHRRSSARPNCGSSSATALPRSLWSPRGLADRLQVRVNRCHPSAGRGLGLPIATSTAMARLTLRMCPRISTTLPSRNRRQQTPAESPRRPNRRRVPPPAHRPGPRTGRSRGLEVRPLCLNWKRACGHRQPALLLPWESRIRHPALGVRGGRYLTTNRRPERARRSR